MKSHLQLACACALAGMITSCDRKSETEAPAAPGAKPAHERYSLQWVSNDIPATMPAGKSVPIKVSVKNTGDWPWNDPFAANPAHPDGTYAVRLTYGWVSGDGKPLPANSVRGELTAPIPPGGTANFTIKVETPKVPGNYQLQLDLVEELVFFFSDKGNEKLTVPVTVQ